MNKIREAKWKKGDISIWFASVWNWVTHLHSFGGQFNSLKFHSRIPLNRRLKLLPNISHQNPFVFVEFQWLFRYGRLSIWCGLFFPKCKNYWTLIRVKYQLIAPNVQQIESMLTELNEHQNYDNIRWAEKLGLYAAAAFGKLNSFESALWTEEVLRSSVAITKNIRRERRHPTIYDGRAITWRKVGRKKFDD